MLHSLNNQLVAMEPGHLEALAARLAKISPEMVARLDFEAGDSGPGYDVVDGIAQIPVAGVLLRSTQDAQLYRAFGEEATSYGEIQSAVSAANADPAVRSILFVVDSPGGQVSGVHAAADSIAKSAKPTSAHISTLGASAAYWLASQTGSVSASRGAQIGSIGAYMAVLDMSQMAAAQGIKVHVIASGPHKGAGVPGASISADQLAEMQRRIDATASEFVSDVARGRGTTPTLINESADGRVYSAVESASRGLIDSITSDPAETLKKDHAMKDVAALLKDHPEAAALIAEKLAAGVGADAIRAEVEKAKAEKAVNDKIVAAEKARDEAVAQAKAAADKAEAAEKKAAEVAAKLAEVEKANAALKALGDGAKAADDVKADAAKADKTEMALDEYNKLSLQAKSDFVKAGGKIL
jgi:signal peptide peptidase SppA